MKRGLLFSGLLALMLGVTTAHAQLYSYTNDLGGAPASTAANTTGSSLTRVNGALSITGCPDGFNSNRFSEATTYATSRPAIEFSLGPNTGYQINITSLSVDARRNNKGPVTWRLAYSVDGGASWNDNGSDLTVSATACATSNTLTWDIPDFAMVTPIYVRIYAYAANSNLNGIATVRNVNLGGFVTFADVDADGYTSNVDCDDFNPAINPAATEVCDGVDNDCDGSIDEGVQLLFYADTDGDGFGDAGNTTLACSLPAGYSTDNTDCNDANAAVNPAASEVCNGIDDDCDGPADEDLPFDTWFADADGDTYGDAAMFVSTCDGAPAGYVADNTDCNDADAAVSPAGTEVCNGIDDDCDGSVDEGVTTTFYADADGDSYGDAASTTEACSAPAGYVSDNTDCNDLDATVNPGAAEVCNGVDDDCDGSVDEGVTTTFYADADGDSYGDAASTTEACSAPAGYVSDNTDCNDADATVNPGAAEICNGVDDDCDGSVDEGVTTTFYADADGDSYGDAASTTEACSAPAGYVSDNTDCNDADAGINPGAAEICNGIDEDCDGFVDEGTLITFYADADADGFGDAASNTDACSAPAGYVANNADCNDASNTVYPGAPEICGNGIDEDCDGVIDLTATIAAGGPTTFCVGGSVTLSSTTLGAGLTYQWQKNGNPIAGATASSYVVTTQGNYRCVVSKPSCTSTSSTITVTVNLNPNATIAALDGLDLCGKSFVRLRGNNGTGLSYQWYLDGSPIAGATSQLYYATATGSYQVQVTSAAGCNTLSAASVVFTSCRMTEEAGQANMLILPNPSRGTFDLQMALAQDISANAHVQILNMSGQAVQSFDAEISAGMLNTRIEMAPVAGAYLLVVQVNGAVYTERLMITE